MPEIIKYLDEIEGSGKLVLYGAGSFGKYVHDRIKKERHDLEIVGFVDDKKSGTFLDLPVGNLEFFINKENGLKIIIASSYWKPISEKLKEKGKEFYIADILNCERKDKLLQKEVDGAKLTFYTPNQFLYEVANNIDIIEPGTNAWIKNMQNAVLYDVGASCGVYSILAGIKNNTVIALEPDAQNFSVLKRNLYLNRNILKGNFFPLNLALGSVKEILSFNMLEFGEGFHGRFTSNSERSDSNAFYTEKVMAYSLDDLINDYRLPFPTHIKIDVDGAENDVLKGMKVTLKNETLKEVLIEMNEDQEKEITVRMESCGLKFREKQKINEITGTVVEGVSNLLYTRKK